MIEKKKATISINPPPEDKRCECCGRHISELKPYGGKGDPLVGDFTGALLIKIFRSMAPENKQVREQFEKELYVDGEYSEETKNKLIQEKGEEYVNNLEIHIQAMDTSQASWECRDCVVLSEREYFKKRAVIRLIKNSAEKLTELFKDVDVSNMTDEEIQQAIEYSLMKDLEDN